MEKIRYNPAQLTPYNFRYPGIINKMSSRQIHNILGDTISAMRLLASQHQIILPDDLETRISVVDAQTFSNFVENGLFDDPAAGYTLPNGTCLINHEAIKAKLSRLPWKAPQQYLDRFRYITTHELWHCTSYNEVWLPSDRALSDSPTKILNGILDRRRGIYTDHLYRASEALTKQTKAGDKRRWAIMGLGLLDEGITEYLTRETFKITDQITLQPLQLGYQRQLEVVETLIDKIGADIFLKAKFTKGGLLPLARALEEILGRHALSKLAIEMYNHSFFPLSSAIYRLLSSAPLPTTSTAS